MKIKTQDLTKTALAWAVAKARGATFKPDPIGAIYAYIDGKCIGGFTTKVERGVAMDNPTYRPDRDAGQGFPLMDERGIWLRYYAGDDPADRHCEALSGWFPRPIIISGPRGAAGGGLVAGMRCLVALELGDEVDVPDVLVHEHEQMAAPVARQPDRPREGSWP